MYTYSKKFLSTKTDNEIVKMLTDAGLQTLGLLGSVKGEPYSESSERMILHGLKF